MPWDTNSFINFMLRPIHLSKGPISFPIISIVKVARKRVRQEISTPVKRYYGLSTETLGNYTQEGTVKLKVNDEFQSLDSFWLQTI